MITGIITNAMMASIKSKLADYKETAETYVFGQIAAGVENDKINAGRKAYDEETDSYYLPNTEKGIKEIITNIEEFYEERMIIMKGELYYCYLAYEGESANDDIPTYAAEMGIKVIQYGNFTYDGEESVYSNLISYIKDEEGNIIGQTQYHMCTPDLSGFDTDTTYYVSYSDISNVSTLKILNKISDAYSYTNAWYDYPQKNWANVLTLNNEIMTYWVWIPRFAYDATQLDSTAANYILDSLDSEGNYDNLNVMFIDKENRYYNASTDSMEAIGENYVVPDSFSFGGIELGGFWMSKYQVQEQTGNAGEFYITASVDAIGVVTSTKENIENYRVYIDASKTPVLGTEDAGIQLNTARAITKDGDGTAIKPDTTYLVSIYDSYGVRKWTQSIHTLTYQPESEIYANISIDISGFDSSRTYFVLYDRKGGNPILVPFSSGTTSMTDIENYLAGISGLDYNDSDGDGKGYFWFNYGDKRGEGYLWNKFGGSAQDLEANYSDGVAKIWANIATITPGSGTNCGSIAFWTYIPRYCYYQVGGISSTSFDMRFIPVNVTDSNIGKQDADDTNDEGESIIYYTSVDVSSDYVIPDAFKFGTTGSGDNEKPFDISGYWMSKYQVETLEKFPSYYAIVDQNKITIMNKLGDISSKEPFGGYTATIFETGGSTDYGTASRNVENPSNPITSSYTSPSLSYNTNYVVNVYANLKLHNGSYLKVLQYSETLKTAVQPVSYDYANITIDLSGFDEDTTMLVLYNSDKEETLNNVSMKNLRYNATSWSGGSWVGADTDDKTDDEYIFVSEYGSGTVVYGGTTYTWFNYSNKVWANIKTTANAELWKKDGETFVSKGTTGATSTYFTYVPRYAYYLDNSTYEMEIKFVDKNNKYSNNGTQTALPSSDWIVPNAFKFGSEDLYGFWMSKYQVGV